MSNHHWRFIAFFGCLAAAICTLHYLLYIEYSEAGQLLHTYDKLD